MEESKQQFPLSFNSPKGGDIVVVSSNILAQHLIIGNELPSYRQFFDPKNIDPLRKLRLEQMSKFLISLVHFDVLNIQEVGHVDEQLIKCLAEQFNLHLEMTTLPTGGAGLRIASLFNKDTIALVSSEPLTCKKNGRLCHYGLHSTMIQKKTEKQINVINVHFSAGANDTDQKLREFQLSKLTRYLKPYTIITGDFNMNVSLVHQGLKNLVYGQAQFIAYNTENRLQNRQRNGSNGLKVAYRCIDGVFFTSEFDISDALQPTDQFDKMMNSQKLAEFSERLKDKAADHEAILKEAREIEVGFPNSNWFSDHLPVGAVLKFKD